MTDRKPTAEQGPQEKAATPWRVRFTCGKAKPSYNEIRKDLLAATWGNNKMADLLFHFLNKASWDAHNAHIDASVKKIAVETTHAKIQTKVKVSEPTLVSHLKAFASAGYVRKTAYRGAFEVDFEAIEKAFDKAPERQSTSASKADSLSLNLSLSQEVKELRLEVQKLSTQVEDLSLTLVSFKFQRAQPDQGFKFNLSLPLVSGFWDEAATEANLAHIFKSAETKELYLNKSSRLAPVDGSGVQKCPKNILDIRGLEDLDKEREEGTYRASEQPSQQCANAQPAPAPAHRVDDSTGADHNPRRSQTSGTQAGDAQNQGSASGAPGQPTTVVAPAAGGYKTPDEKPAGKRGGRSKAKEPDPEFTEGGKKVWDAWRKQFKSTPRCGPETTKCANALYERNLPWCHELRVTMHDLLKEQKGWVFTSDPNWYRSKGVTLCDIDSRFERWQSAKTEALEQEAKQAQHPVKKEPTILESLRAQQQRFAQLGGVQ